MIMNCIFSNFVVSISGKLLLLCFSNFSNLSKFITIRVHLRLCSPHTETGSWTGFGISLIILNNSCRHTFVGGSFVFYCPPSNSLLSLSICALLLLECRDGVSSVQVLYCGSSAVIFLIVCSTASSRVTPSLSISSVS